MTRGKEVRDLLVIHPVESMWTMVRSGWRDDPAVQAYDRLFIVLGETLLGAHVDFDFGDEEILSRHARVESTASGPVLLVGQARYTTVVVPPLRTMRASTLALLAQFHAAGGTVVFVGEPAAYVDAVASDAVPAFAAQCVNVPAPDASLARAVKPCRRVAIADETGQEIPEILYLLREDEEHCYLFACNTGDRATEDRSIFEQPRAIERTAAFPSVHIRGFAGCAGHPLELDPTTGEIFMAAAERDGDGWLIHTDFPALGSRLFVAPKHPQAVTYSTRPVMQETTRAILNTERWTALLSEDNVLPLDRPNYRIGNGAWLGPEEILRVDRKVREAMGLPVRGGAMVQPWAREQTAETIALPVTLAYTFTVDCPPSGSLALALEQPERFRIAVNDIEISPLGENGWWTDRSLRRVPFDPALLRSGENRITLSLQYTDTFPGLEIIYLLGHFGVEVAGTALTVTSQPGTLQVGDWVTQGLPFYAGSVTYRQEITVPARVGERVVLQVPSYRGVAVRILVNGQCAGIIAWEPNEVDITDLLTGDTADLRIEVIGHRRNSHGPFHLTEKWPAWTGPGEFVATDDRWYDGYQLVPCGLLEAPVLVWKTVQPYQKERGQEAIFLPPFAR